MQLKDTNNFKGLDVYCLIVSQQGYAVLTLCENVLPDTFSSIKYMYVIYNVYIYMFILHTHY